jgi:hypothetical protein
MARFYGEVRALEKPKSASRVGHKGIVAHVRGWDIGIEASVYINEKGKDEVSVILTGGSRKPHGKVVFTNRHTGETKTMDDGWIFTFEVPDLDEES